MDAAIVGQVSVMCIPVRVALVTVMGMLTAVWPRMVALTVVVPSLPLLARPLPSMVMTVGSAEVPDRGGREVELSAAGEGGEDG